MLAGRTKRRVFPPVFQFVFKMKVKGCEKCICLQIIHGGTKLFFRYPKTRSKKNKVELSTKNYVKTFHK